MSSNKVYEVKSASEPDLTKLKLSCDDDELTIYLINDRGECFDQTFVSLKSLTRAVDALNCEGITETNDPLVACRAHELGAVVEDCTGDKWCADGTPRKDTTFSLDWLPFKIHWPETDKHADMEQSQSSTSSQMLEDIERVAKKAIAEAVEKQKPIEWKHLDSLTKALVREMFMDKPIPLANTLLLLSALQKDITAAFERKGG